MVLTACFSSTLLPGTRSEYSACLFLSAYNLAFTFISPSQSCTSLTTRSSWNSGNLVRIFLPNRSSSGLRHSGGGVRSQSVCYQVFANFFLPRFPFDLRNLQPFQKSWFCLSTSPFAWGHNGTVFICSIPQPSKYLSNGPLSLVTDSGKPRIMKILSRLLMISEDVVEHVISIS